jgi:HAD superfamily hydrolase (TIGR01458 family)
MPRRISGFLIDIDGVLISGNQRLEGSQETIQFLIEKDIPFLLVTNTTRQSRITIWHHLKRLGFPIKESDILTAPLAAVKWLKSKNVKSINLFLTGSAVNDFKDFKITAFNPEYVVIGDIGQNLTFDKLNSTFRIIMGGAKLLALHKNRYWQTGEGLTIDAGAWVAALEYASHKRAFTIGKPHKDFFGLAANYLNIDCHELAMIGDDIETDVNGAQKAGLFGILIKTGKYNPKILNNLKIYPNEVLDSIADLPNFVLKNTGK